MQLCLNCQTNIKNSNKYCSNKCQADYEHNMYIDKWKLGEATGIRGINTKNISEHLRGYLFKKFGNACSVCGWSEVNPSTGRIPLEVDHIDGDAENNSESNLRILCPNCHSLTPSFRNLNKGKGRGWRRLKYVKLG